MSLSPINLLIKHGLKLAMLLFIWESLTPGLYLDDFRLGHRLALLSELETKPPEPVNIIPSTPAIRRYARLPKTNESGGAAPQLKPSADKLDAYTGASIKAATSIKKHAPPRSTPTKLNSNTDASSGATVLTTGRASNKLTYAEPTNTADDVFFSAANPESITRIASANENKASKKATSIPTRALCNRQINRVYLTKKTLENKVIISQLDYGKTSLSNEMFAYQEGKHYYLPLQFLAEQLMLAMQVEMEDLSASGWYMSPKNAIKLSQNLMQYPSHNHDCNSDATLVFYDDWDLYLEQSVVEQMFGLRFQFDKARQRFMLEEQINIPLSQIQARQRRYQLFQDQKAHGPSGGKTIPSGYASLGDLALHADVGIRGKSTPSGYEHKAEGFIQSRADLLGHSSYLGYSWSEQGKNFHAYLEKTLQDSWIKHYRLGNVDSHSLSLISSGNSGQGLTISAGDSFAADLRNIVVEGENEPDWDVELYRNNSLVSVQRVGSDGRYRFEDVPYFIGVNQYQLRFFGPNGEQRVESFSKLLDPSVMEAGSFGLDMGMMQREQDNLKQLYTSANWAISDKVTTGLALVQQEITQDNWQLTPKLTVSLLGDTSVLQANFSKNETGNAASIVAQGSAELLDWQAQWAHFDGFISWDNPEAQTKQTLGMNVSGNIQASNLSWSLSGLWRDQLLGSDLSQINATVSGQVKQLSVSNSLGWQTTDETQRWTDRMTVSGRLADWYLRSYLDLSLSPELELSQWATNASTSINAAMNYQFEISYQPQALAPFILRNTLSYFLDKGAIRFSLENNSHGDWSAQLKWSSSLLYMPEENQWLMDRVSHLNTGSVKIIAFQDDNNDGIQGSDEQPIGGLTFSGHAQASNTTDELGQLLITHLQTSRPHKLVLNEKSLPDPFLVPRDSALSINAHPGNVQDIYFPVLFTAELEGQVFLANDKPAKGTLVTLTQENGKESYQGQVEYDGIFIFERLVPGNYSLEIASLIPLDKPITVTVALKPGDYQTLAPITLKALP